ncbi:MAG TPA: TetR/AcrR family transcriptional regulator [Actinobacteria bacterium]|nr:TetR/AcrR family transcriptional regulator [Actinomycetota bacterium]
MSHTREDVIAAAGRMFAAKGYHGTSMRDLGRELGLLGSSLYSHVGGKQELLVEVVARGAKLFQAAADRALATEGTAADRLRALIAGHVDVVLDHRDEVRTFLNEARSLDAEARAAVVEARDRYEEAFRTVLREGIEDGSFRPEVDPVVDGIFVLSILNAIERWYDVSGPVDRSELVARLHRFVLGGLAGGG